MMRYAYSRNGNQSGNVLFYILICVALLGALSYMMMRGSGESASSSNANRISEDIKSQAQLIRSAVIECNLVYNNGYPAYYNNGTAIPSGTPVSMNEVECLTDPDPMATNAMRKLFGSTGDRFLPVQPKPFTDAWTYSINTSTVPHTISVQLSRAMNCAGDAALNTALTVHLPPQFSTDEVAIVCSGSVASFTLYLVKGV